MLTIILNNPFRILGIKADASRMEVVANAGKIKAFAKINRPLTFPLDSETPQAEISRTEESVDSALAAIQNERDKVKYSLFWFFGTSNEVQVLQDQLIRYLLNDDYGNAVRTASELYESHSQEILSLLSYDNSLLTKEDLRDIFIETLTSEVDFTQIELDQTSISKDWYTALKGQDEVNLHDQIKDVISEIKNSPTAEIKYSVANSFITKNEDKIKSASKSVDSTSPLYPVLDNFADELINCAVDYQQKSYDYYADKKCMILAQFAEEIAQVAKTKNRCSENLKTFKENIETLLPESYSDEAQKIKALRVDYRNSGKTLALGKTLAENALPILSSIKSKSGLSKAYLTCSSNIVEDVLTVIIDRVTEAMHGSKSEQKKELKEAYETAVVLGSLDMDEKYKKDRYDANVKVLKVMCLRRGIIKRTFKEMLLAEDSSSWQAALIIHIIAIIAGAIITDNGDAASGAGLGFVFGGFIWLSCWRDRSEDEMGDDLWGCLGSFGCLSFFLFAAIAVYWFTLKLVKNIINKIKEINE